MSFIFQSVSNAVSSLTGQPSGTVQQTNCCPVQQSSCGPSVQSFGGPSWGGPMGGSYCSPSSGQQDKEMREAYDLGQEIVRNRIMQDNPEDITLLQEVQSDDIIVVQGCYDHIHNVLTASKVPFTFMNAYEVCDLELRSDQTVYVNCGSDQPPALAQHLARFVEKGGLLITTDWGLKNVIEVGFPGTVEYNGLPTGDEVVSIEIVDKSDEVCTGFFDEATGDEAPRWWLEGSSYPIRVLDPTVVTKLVVSKELGEKYGDDAVIVRIKHGEGLVYHMLSHFYLQRSDTRSQKHQATAAAYAASKTKAPLSAAAQQKFAGASVQWSSVQSAATSTEFVMRNTIAQKKRSKARQQAMPVVSEA